MAIVEPIAGQRIGEYVLEEMIGQGAFAQVWRARHHLLADKVVAFKIPTNEEYVRNLQKEGVIQHDILHPNIVQTLGLDPWHDPPYLMMEYVAGSSLRDLLDEMGRLHLDEAVRIIIPVLEALAAAHKKDIIHRDLKPENILLGADGTVKVSDFGLGLASESTSLSLSVSIGSAEEARKIVGTLDYMAPEQRRAGQATPQSDLYSAGAVLYEMLTGSLPVGRFRLPSEHNPRTPQYVDEIIERCLASDPGDRPGMAAEVVAAFTVSPGAQEATWQASATEAQAPTERPKAGGVSSVLDKEPTLLLELAKEDFRRRRFGDTVTKLLQAQRFPTARAEAVNVARRLADRARGLWRHELAVDLYDVVLLHHPNEVGTLVKQASAAMHAGMKDRALHAVRRALQLEPENREAQRLRQRIASGWYWLRFDLKPLLKRHAAGMVGLLLLAAAVTPFKALVRGEDPRGFFGAVPVFGALVAAIISWPTLEGLVVALFGCLSAFIGGLPIGVNNKDIQLHPLPFLAYCIGAYLVWACVALVIRYASRERRRYAR